MLAKKYRLPIQEMTGKNGKTYKSAFFTIKVFSSDKGFSRFGVIISKKVGKTAVVRNKIKRAIFDALYPVREKFPNADYLIITNPAISEIDKEKIHEQIISLSFN